MRARTTGARTLLALMTVLAAGLAAGCGSEDPASDAGTTAATGAADERTILTFLYAPRGFNDVTRAWSNGFDAAADELEGRFVVEQKATSRPELDPGAYLNTIRQSLVQQPDGIVVVPNNAAAMKSGLERIAAEGTPVLIMDQDVPGMEGKVSFVGTDNRAAGATAAEWLLEQHEAGDLPSTQVGVLRSPPGITSTDDRLAGFTEALEGSELEIVQTISPGCDDSARARSATADLLSAQPDLGGLYAVCDVIALGAARALQAAERLDVGLVSVDASQDGVQSIVDGGGIDAEVAQHLFRMGRESVTTLARSLAGETVPDRVDTGTELVTKENAAEYLRRAEAESK